MDSLALAHSAAPIPIRSDLSEELARLRAENARLRALSQNAFDIAVLLDENGVLQTVSPAAARVLGADFAAGAPLWNWVHPDDLGRLQRDFATAQSGAEIVIMRSFRMRIAENNWLWLEATLRDARAACGVGALVFNARATTPTCQAGCEARAAEAALRRAETEAALRRAEAELDGVINAAPIFVFRWNREGVYTWARGNFNTVLGVSPQDRIGRSVYDLFAHKPEIARNFERALAGETFQTTVHFGAHPFDAHYAPAVDEDGQIVGVIGATADVSRLYAAELAIDQARAQAEIEAAQTEVLERLARAGEFRDDDTGQHTQRVGNMAARLAARCGFCEQRTEIMRRAAPLHDIGKIGVPDSILLKPGKLTAEEFAVIKTHCEIGARLLSNGKSELVQMAQTIARSHHERFDGNGYPDHLAGEQIPVEGRIVAVVDVYDALTSQRPYKEAWPVPRALAEIERNAGTQFDPIVVRAFLEMFSSNN